MNPQINYSLMIIFTGCITLVLILSHFSIKFFDSRSKAKNIEKIKRTNTIKVFRIFETTETTEITYKD